ncbi:hypothetical protein C5167_032766 [Papaver somniferum]|uniref:Uncharacterized protein n=1 Tax=Papaver somniferum TaxID=3469 RepID=A0A4Y7K8H1_PAPSO|nr:hypothetical protein C5167_032766 [Papaver somniferum]
MVGNGVDVFYLVFSLEVTELLFSLNKATSIDASESTPFLSFQFSGIRTSSI